MRRFLIPLAAALALAACGPAPKQAEHVLTYASPYPRAASSSPSPPRWPLPPAGRRRSRPSMC